MPPKMYMNILVSKWPANCTLRERPSIHWTHRLRSSAGARSTSHTVSTMLKATAPASACHFHLPEPAERCEGQFQPPDAEGDYKDGNAVQAIPGRPGSPAIRVTIDMACGKDNVQDQQDREDRCRREEGGDGLPGVGRRTFDGPGNWSDFGRRGQCKSYGGLRKERSAGEPLGTPDRQSTRGRNCGGPTRTRTWDRSIMSRAL